MIVTTEGLRKLGATVKAWKDQFIMDRGPLELQMMKNLRQYLGQFDPEVEKRIPLERSKAYPRDTRVKVKGGVAKMMEMMFPAKDANWELTVTEVPSIPKEDLQEIIQRLEAEAQAAAEQATQEAMAQDPSAQPVPPQPIDGEAIEREVRKFADSRKDAMQAEIADQLHDPDTDYPNLCKRVVRSGYIYGFGVARSPMVRTQKERVWKFNEQLGTYEAKEVTLKRPYPEYVRVWNCYPDLSAQTWEDQERFFERFIFHRHDLRGLAKRPDFKAEPLLGYLKVNQEGNYRPSTHDIELHRLAGTANLANRDRRRYEVFRHLGFVSAHELAAAGVEVPQNQMDQDVLADIWLIDDVVIKAEIAAFGSRPCGEGGQYHAFVYSDDEDAGMTGQGLPEEIRDTSMSICATTRMLMDNMAATAGPIFETNIDLLPPGKKGNIGAIHAFMNIERTGEGAAASAPAVRAITTESRISEFLATLKAQREQLDIESALPAWTFGAVQNMGEGLRTSTNMSMMTGSANMMTKDVVRSFDRFTSSLIGSLLAWNMEFNPNEKLKGDYQVLAKGNLSLVARELRGAALDQFVLTLTPEDKATLDMRGIMLDRLKTRDLPTDRVLPKDEADRNLAEMRQAQQQAASVEQGYTQAKTQSETAKAGKLAVETQIKTASAEAIVQETLSRVESNMANAKSAADKAKLENLKIILESAANEQGGAGPGSGGAPKSRASGSRKARS